ncbi:MAG TPA: DUF4136 domain-containing protein [Candidatus Eisenbacteria bacterium]|nr:DUF4136 domain-containing protein [Candidatus Eisenbacteria bacterium]
MLLNLRRAALPGLAVTLVTCLLCTGATAEKIRVHYDKSIDFSKYKTYGWAPVGAVAHPMLALDIVGAVDSEMAAQGLTKVAANPDLLVQIYGAVDSEVSMTSNNPIYNATGGIPPFDPSMTSPGNSLYWDGYYGNSTVVVHPGELVVDLIDVKAKKLVWRGMGSEAISGNPEKLESEANSTISKMFKDYPVKK